MRWWRVAYGPRQLPRRTLIAGAFTIMRRKLILMSLAAVTASGCASIIDGANQTMTFKSIPEAATLSVYNKSGEKIHAGATPLTLSLKRGAGFFQAESYRVRFEKEGYKPSEILVSGSMNGWYLGNLLLGGLIGMLIVDPMTGAMYKLTPEELNVEMDAGPKTSYRDGELIIALKQDVADSLFRKATLIASR